MSINTLLKRITRQDGLVFLLLPVMLVGLTGCETDASLNAEAESTLSGTMEIWFSSVRIDDQQIEQCDCGAGPVSVSGYIYKHLPGYGRVLFSGKRFAGAEPIAFVEGSVIRVGAADFTLEIQSKRHILSEVEGTLWFRHDGGYSGSSSLGSGSDVDLLEHEWYLLSAFDE